MSTEEEADMIHKGKESMIPEQNREVSFCKTCCEVTFKIEGKCEGCDRTEAQ